MVLLFFFLALVEVLANTEFYFLNEEYDDTVGVFGESGAVNYDGTIAIVGSQCLDQPYPQYGSIGQAATIYSRPSLSKQLLPHR